MVVCCTAAMAIAGCAGEPRQDIKEPKGKFQVSVSSSFPSGQALAKRSELVIKIRNEEARRTVPNVAVTVQGFDYKTKQPDVADPSRPVFAVNGVPAVIGAQTESREATPRGGETAYVSTWALGPLKPGKSRTFRWGVTAVHAGPYKLKYTVAAGLNGKARAVGVSGRTPQGTYKGSISNAPPKTRVADDGKTIIQGTR